MLLNRGHVQGGAINRGLVVAGLLLSPPRACEGQNEQNLPGDSPSVHTKICKDINIRKNLVFIVKKLPQGGVREERIHVSGMRAGLADLGPQ